MDTSQTTGDTFRGEVDSVTGQEILARNFSGGRVGADRPDRHRPERRSKQVTQKPRREFGEVRPGARGEAGRATHRSRCDDAPYSPAALDTIPRLREAVGDGVLVGGPTAQEYDLREAATRDNWLIIPLTLVVVFGILVALLRALVAPLLLIASVILSFAAALGAGVFVSDHIFGFSGVGPTLPLLAFVFLVALGIDYNIFLMARVREEAQQHGTREGTLRGLAVTGRGHHRRRDRARRDVRRARRAPARRADADRLHRRVRRAAGHVHRALDDRAGGGDRRRRPRLVAVEAGEELHAPVTGESTFQRRTVGGRSASLSSEVLDAPSCRRSAGVRLRCSAAGSVRSLRRSDPWPRG